jgi:hypothetical protein
VPDLIGGRGRNRTYNLSVKSRMLCQLSYASFVSVVSVKIVQRLVFTQLWLTLISCGHLKNIAQSQGCLKTPKRCTLGRCIQMDHVRYLHWA